MDHGHNCTVGWSPDGTRIIVQVSCSSHHDPYQDSSCDFQTSESYLVLITIEYQSEDVAYGCPPLPPSAQRTFLPGAGEGLPLQAVNLRFDGVIRVEGNLLR
jgi:hypothetical protein